MLDRLEKNFTEQLGVSDWSLCEGIQSSVKEIEVTSVRLYESSTKKKKQVI